MRLRRRGLSCQQLVELVSDYHEGALSRATRRRFEGHIARCDGCSAYVEQMRQTIRLTGRLRSESIPEQTLEELLRVFSNWKGVER